MPFNAETLRFLSPQFRVGYGTWQAPDELTEAGVYNAIKIGYRQIDCAHIYGMFYSPILQYILLSKHMVHINIVHWSLL